MKKLLFFLILLFSLNLNASEFYNLLNKSSPSMMDFGLLKIELELEKEKKIIIKQITDSIKTNLKVKFIDSSYWDKKLNDIEFKDNLQFNFDEEKIDYLGEFNHSKNKIILELDFYLYVKAFSYTEFLKENFDTIEPKRICNAIRNQIQRKLTLFGTGQMAKNHFFNEYFSHTGKVWKDEIIQNENTNLAILLHWSYLDDDIPGLRTTACSGDIASDSFYREYEYYLKNNMEEHVKFLESL